ncbi:MAG TPA: DUF6263 family protein [Candidatus Acidoferrum sp.]|nr:DUF6263 family protein [Candidatus Acidoferrum sp.]
MVAELDRARGRGGLSRLLSAVSIAALAIGACKGEARSPSAPAPAGEAERTPAVGLTAAPVGPGTAQPATVVLLEPGKEPRTVLRYSLSPSAREKLGLTMTMAMEMGLAGHNMRMQVPPIHMENELAVAEKLGEREVLCRFAITSAELLPGGDKIFESARGQLEAELKKTVGTHGTLAVDDRGLNLRLDLALPAGMDPQMSQAMQSSRQALEHVSSPLPEEAVGVGARWQMDQSIEHDGIKMKQKVSYELVELKGQRAQLHATIEQTADPQVATMPGLPPGLRAELLSHTGSGSGTIDIDLSKLVPTSSSSTIHTETSIKVTGQGQDQTMLMKADSKVEISRL